MPSRMPSCKDSILMSSMALHIISILALLSLKISPCLLMELLSSWSSSSRKSLSYSWVILVFVKASAPLHEICYKFVFTNHENLHFTIIYSHSKSSLLPPTQKEMGFLYNTYIHSVLKSLHMNRLITFKIKKMIYLDLSCNGQRFCVF